MVVLAIAAAVAFVSLPGSRPAVPSTRSAGLLPPERVLSQSPYMGVACPQPNAISCDRIGLAIWLKRPALSVEATIAGQPLKLDWFGEEARFTSVTPRTEFTGYLQPAGLTTRLRVRAQEASLDPHCGCRRGGPTWGGNDAPSPLVRLQIVYADHTRAVTQLHVGLAAGWG